ncbi:MAG: class I SAM-dependent methyltransferase [Actinomycetes bacterium]
MTRIGISQSESTIVRDSQAYWQGESGTRWRKSSHWRGDDGLSEEQWDQLGREHLRLFDRLVRVLGTETPMPRVVEWGCGGGSNAVHFAPRAEQFIGVDVAAASLAECEKQVERVCTTPFQGVLAKAPEPEAAARQVSQPCDLFLCLHVLECLPTPEYGLRVMRIARDMLRPGGLAFVQVKYSTTSWRTKPRRRSYRHSFGQMTTYRIEEFWTSMQECGLRPEAVSLVPSTRVGDRYAYFLLSKT